MTVYRWQAIMVTVTIALDTKEILPLTPKNTKRNADMARAINCNIILCKTPKTGL